MSTTFHQAALPPGWHLADEATLPGGRSLTGTAARVYNLLVETIRHAHRWPVGRLLQAFHSGRLLSALAGCKECCLWADPAAAYNPSRVLQTALSKLGATIQGAFTDGP